MTRRCPLGEADHVIQLPRQGVDVLLLLLQSQIVVLSQRLRARAVFTETSPEDFWWKRLKGKCKHNLELVYQDLSLPVDLHDQVTDGLLYFVCHSFPVLLHLLQSVEVETEGEFGVVNPN